MTTLQDIMGLITKRKIKTPKDSDYIISAAYTDTQERLKPQPKMEASLLSIGAIKNYILSNIPIGGSQTLAQTLVIGNNTGGTDILLNSTDAIQLENGSSVEKGTYDFGADGGVSRICGVGFEDMWQSGIRHVFDSNGLIRHSTNCFEIIPDNTFDNSKRFKFGSLWTLDDGTTYRCIDDAVGAAIWELYSSPTSNYKVFTALLTQRGNRGDITDISGGDLEIGVTYKINNNINGDFTNVGAPNNNNGTYFIATGTTPNSWGVSILGDTLTFVADAPTAIVLENTIGNVWFEYNDVGQYTANSSDLFTIDKTTIDIDAYGQNGNAEGFALIANSTVNLANKFTIYTVKGSPTSNILENSRLEIRVYN